VTPAELAEEPPMPGAAAAASEAKPMEEAAEANPPEGAAQAKPSEGTARTD
jgi:hypothetical protein